VTRGTKTSAQKATTINRDVISIHHSEEQPFYGTAEAVETGSSGRGAPKELIASLVNEITAMSPHHAASSSGHIN